LRQTVFFFEEKIDDKRKKTTMIRFTLLSSHQICWHIVLSQETPTSKWTIWQ